MLLSVFEDGTLTCHSQGHSAHGVSLHILEVNSELLGCSDQGGVSSYPEDVFLKAESQLGVSLYLGKADMSCDVVSRCSPKNAGLGASLKVV